MLEAIDSHAHLDQVKNLEDALVHSFDSGVKTIIAVSTDYNSCIKTLEISKNQRKAKVYCALGVHPWEIIPEEAEKALEFIKENIKDCVAIGEIGLDYWYKEVKKDKTKREIQKEIFQKQLNLANEFNLPAIIHSRGAWKDCFEICRQSKVKKAVFHWYSGPLDVLKEIFGCGYFVSATPALNYSPQHQEAIKNSALDNLLIETDSPVFYKNGESGFTAEPKDVLRTLELVSKIKNIEKDTVAKKTIENTKKLFNLN